MRLKNNVKLPERIITNYIYTRYNDRNMICVYPLFRCVRFFSVLLRL